MVTTRADHELQARTVPLPSPPGKPADRATLPTDRLATGIDNKQLPGGLSVLI
jgi:hypothetical protein